MNIPVSQKRKQKLDQALLNLIIKDIQPFSVVADQGFVEFVWVLDPNYQLPDRHKISRTLIPARYEQCKNEMSELLKQGKTFCITTDCWTSNTTVSYTVVTAHFLDKYFKLHSVMLECSANSESHTAVNMAQEIKKITTKWNIKDETIILAVSDNAANVTQAFEILQWKHLGCIAHTINLIVKDALKNADISLIIEKIKQIVCHFRRSYISAEKLRKQQENQGKIPLRLIQEVATRWNSTLYMIQRFVELKDAIRSTLAILDKDLPYLTASEWKNAEELTQILEPFEEATRAVSGENFCTAALVIPLCNGLQRVCDQLCEMKFTKCVADVAAKLKSGLQERLGNVENSNTLSMCTFLDPRFKNVAFQNVTQVANVKKRLINLISERMSLEGIEGNTSSTMNKDNDAKDDASNEVATNNLSIWRKHDKTVAVAKPCGTTASRAILEMQRYLEEHILDRETKDSSCLEWWQKNKLLFPHLAEIAREKLCALASSVPCERLFSKAGQILSDRRNRLSDSKAQMLLFLNANVKL